MTTGPLYDLARGAQVWRDHTGDTDPERPDAIAKAFIHVRPGTEDWRDTVIAQACPDQVPPFPVAKALDAMAADLAQQQAEVLEAHKARVAKLEAFTAEVVAGLDADLLNRIRDRDRDRCRFCDYRVVWDDDDKNNRAVFALADPDSSDYSMDSVVVSCAGCDSTRKRRGTWDPFYPTLMPPYSDRRLAHELYPAPEEYEIQKIDAAVRYHYARALGARMPFGEGWTDSPGYVDRLIRMIEARNTAYLYDALAQGLTGQEAVDFAENASWDYEGEILWERAQHYGIDPHLILPYPIDEDRTVDRVLHAMAVEVEKVNRANGWFDDDRTFGDDIALLHSEVSEALEAFRDHGLDDATARGSEDHGRWCKAQGYAGPCPSESCPIPKPEGVGSELADVLIRLLDTAQRRGIDLGAEYRRKIAFNRTRGHRHGGKRL